LRENALNRDKTTLDFCEALFCVFTHSGNKGKRFRRNRMRSIHRVGIRKAVVSFAECAAPSDPLDPALRWRQSKILLATSKVRMVLNGSTSGLEREGFQFVHSTAAGSTNRWKQKQIGRDRMSELEMKAELERLRAENAQLKNKKPGGLSFKVSEKGAVSLYGMGRFPVTLYKEQWLRILASAAEIEAFIRENDSKLKTKE